MISLNASVKALSGIVNSGRSGAAWASDIGEALENIHCKILAAQEAISSILEDGRADIDEQIILNAQEALAAISSTIPAGVVELLTGRDTTGQDLDLCMSP